MRDNGYYWVMFSHELQSKGFTCEWVIGLWDGNYFWINGDDFSPGCFGDIDPSRIQRAHQ